MPFAPDNPPTFSLVVPCYNEEDGIRATLAQLEHDLMGAPPHEIIVVDDGSTDDTATQLTAAAADLPNVVTVAHAYNQGYGAALKTGIRRAHGGVIVITDADGTYPNDRIGDLLRALADCDMAVGARILKDEVTYPLIRRIPKLFLVRYAQWLARQPIPDLNSGLRAFRKEVAERYFHILPDGFSFTTTITVSLLCDRYRVAWVPIGYKARIGRSKIKPIRDTLRFVQLITRTGMYFAPLRLLSLPILLLSLAFLVSLGWDIWQGNLGDKTVLLLVFVLNLLLLGLLADLVVRRTSA